MNSFWIATLAVIGITLIVLGAKKKQSKEATGLGWEETYLGGSEAAEAAFIKQAIKDIHEVQSENKTKAHATQYKRAFHAKIRTGVTNAFFRISPDIPKGLQVGYFIPGRQYQACVRLSNASGVAQADTAKDLRGLAVQIDVLTGKHDFLATNGIVNHARNAKQFIDFAKAAAGPRLLMLPRLICSVGVFETVRMLATVAKQTSKPIDSLATETYWSRAPYLFATRALKFQFIPSKSHQVNIAKGPDFLRDDMVARLKQGAVIFDFQVQLFENEKETPIEDGSVEWKTSLKTIAQLVIPMQSLDSAEARSVESQVDSMEFNPWNTTPEFRPLGSLNRARRLVYEASAELRKNRET